MDVGEFCSRYLTDRKGTDCVKWDSLEKEFGDGDLIAMWVADMEFKAPKAVIEALKNRAEQGVFGYSYVPDSYYDAFIKWEKDRHGFTVKREWMRFSPGVVAALYWFINAFTHPGDAVGIMTPVYYPFHNAIADNGRKLIATELINTGGVYTIDYDLFERNIVANDVKLFIQCSPHNPVGRVWKEEELDRVLSICEKRGVLVVSDEIHQDFILGGNRQIPAAAVSGGKYADNLIAVTAPSKTFNMAGLLNSHIIIPNKEIRNRYDAYAKTVDQIGMNVLSITAAEAAYTYGGEWLDSLLDVIRHNYNIVKSRLNRDAPGIVVTPLEGTYLAWLDLRNYIDPEDTKEFIQDRCRLAVDLGEWFARSCKGFVRLNLATDPKYVEQAADSIAENIKRIAE